MSKPKLVVSLAIALAALVGGWWAAKTFWLTAPPAHSTQMIAYGVTQQTAGSPVAMTLRLAESALVSDGQIKGPVPVSMPAPTYTPLAKKNEVKEDIVTLLDVDASGSVAGVREISVHHYSSSVSAGLAKSDSSAALARSVLTLRTPGSSSPPRKRASRCPRWSSCK